MDGIPVKSQGLDSTKNPSPGSLEIICGPMFSGKSDELMRRLRRARIAFPGQGAIIAFKHSLDDRHGATAILSHDGTRFEAHPTGHDRDILRCASAPGCIVVGIDEVQFFPKAIVSTICTLVGAGKKVVVAGLDMDFRCQPFGHVPTLLALADSVTKLTAICTSCGKDATLTERLVNGTPAQIDDPVVLVGEDEYQARCRGCHSIGKTASQQ